MLLRMLMRAATRRAVTRYITPTGYARLRYFELHADMLSPALRLRFFTPLRFDATLMLLLLFILRRLLTLPVDIFAASATLITRHATLY